MSVARTAFVNGTVDIFWIAAGMLALGALAALVLVKRSDLRQEREGQGDGWAATA